MQENKVSEIKLSDRKHMSVSGVGEILSFDDRSVVLDTALGTLHIDGNSLAVKRLDLETGQASVSGDINGIFYLENGKSKKRRKDAR
ncbi:MAG: sporulation protein YabP [Clostridia bacterium]|nr:sporulation protein YabP [Clostridia bacterium]